MRSIPEQQVIVRNIVSERIDLARFRARVAS
jgi:hypothetical protein